MYFYILKFYIVFCSFCFLSGWYLYLRHCLQLYFAFSPHIIPLFAMYLYKGFRESVFSRFVYSENHLRKDIWKVFLDLEQLGLSPIWRIYWIYFAVLLRLFFLLPLDGISIYVCILNLLRIVDKYFMLNWIFHKYFYRGWNLAIYRCYFTLIKTC